MGRLKYFYVNNYRSLRNFKLNPGEDSAILLTGRNGSGKSSVVQAFCLMKQLVEGGSRVERLVNPRDFSFHETGEPMRFEAAVEVEGREFVYSVNISKNKSEAHPFIGEETLLVDGRPVIKRKKNTTTWWEGDRKTGSRFAVDSQKAAAAFLVDTKKAGELAGWKNWLKRALAIDPVPDLIGGESVTEDSSLLLNCSNFASYARGLLGRRPAAYEQIRRYLKELMPDLQGLDNPETGSKTRMLIFNFERGGMVFNEELDDLSSGEKCMFAGATLLAALDHGEAELVIWDEPDSHLSPWDLEFFIRNLRQKFHQKGQLIITSNKTDTYNCFSNENTFLLHRDSHLEPTRIDRLDSRLKSRDCLSDAIMDGTL